MSTFRDIRGNQVGEGRFCVLKIGGELCLAKVHAITPILERGPFQGGINVKFAVAVDMALPQGHFDLPVFLTEDPPKKEQAAVTEA